MVPSSPQRRLLREADASAGLNRRAGQSDPATLAANIIRAVRTGEQRCPPSGHLYLPEDNPHLPPLCLCEIYGAMAYECYLSYPNRTTGTDGLVELYEYAMQFGHPKSVFIYPTNEYTPLVYMTPDGVVRLLVDALTKYTVWGNAEKGHARRKIMIRVPGGFRSLHITEQNGQAPAPPLRREEINNATEAVRRLVEIFGGTA
jgi:hypothetical protein